MSLKVSAAILALLPFAMCDLLGNGLSTPNSNALDVRAAEPVKIVPLTPSQDQPYFMVTGFDAFMPSAEYSSNFSRAVFNIRLMHPVVEKRWTTRCFAHTRGELCGPNIWTDCMPVAGEENRGEKVSFKFGDNLSSVDIIRRWTHNGVGLRIMASEPATWVQKASLDDSKGNVTVSAMGNWYKKPEAWVFTWKQAVG